MKVGGNKTGIKEAGIEKVGVKEIGNKDGKMMSGKTTMTGSKEEDRKIKDIGQRKRKEKIDICQMERERCQHGVLNVIGSDL